MVAAAAAAAAWLRQRGYGGAAASVPAAGRWARVPLDSRRPCRPWARRACAGPTGAARRRRRGPAKLGWGCAVLG
eukprot:3757049-Prymnesium_polylepis.1